MTQSSITKRQKKDKESIIENLKKIPVIEVAVNKSGVARATYYRWRKIDLKFAQLADEAINEGISLINDMAESQLLSAIKDGNITSIFYWLNHRHPAYGNKLELTSKTDDQKLTEEQEAAVKKALEMGSIIPQNNYEQQDK